MPPLEKLFRLEIEFHRRLPTQAPGTANALHTSYALQAGHEALIAAAEIDQFRERPTFAGDPRDVLAARDSLGGLLGVPRPRARHGSGTWGEI